MRICIAGGIGAGKTATTEYLRALGWVVVDADEIARRITEPNQPAWQALRDAFGDAVLTRERTLDRAFVAQVVFHDASALKRLNHITHGVIGEELRRELDGQSQEVTFVALPLFRPEHREMFQLNEVWAVQVQPEVALARLRSFRGFDEDDARARIAVQSSNDERSAMVDRVIWNDGSLDELYANVDELLRAVGLHRG